MSQLYQGGEHLRLEEDRLTCRTCAGNPGNNCGRPQTFSTLKGYVKESGSVVIYLFLDVFYDIRELQLIVDGCLSRGSNEGVQCHMVTSRVMNCSLAQFLLDSV